MGKINAIIKATKSLCKSLAKVSKKVKKAQKFELYKFFKKGPEVFLCDIKENITLTEMACGAGLGMFGLMQFAVKDQNGAPDSEKYAKKGIASMALGSLGVVLGGPLGGLAGSSLGYFLISNGSKDKPKNEEKPEEKLDVKS